MVAQLVKWLSSTWRKRALMHSHVKSQHALRKNTLPNMLMSVESTVNVACVYSHICIMESAKCVFAWGKKKKKKALISGSIKVTDSTTVLIIYCESNSNFTPLKYVL